MDIENDIQDFISNYDWDSLPEPEGSYRQQQSHFMKGKNNVMHDPQVRETWLKVIKSEEHSIKMSKALRKRGYKHSEETRAKIAKSNTGKSLSEETKEKLRQARLKQDCPRTGKFKEDVSDHALYMREYRKKLREKKKNEESKSISK